MKNFLRPHKQLEFIADNGEHVVSFALIDAPFPKGIAHAIADFRDGICTRVACDSLVSKAVFDAFTHNSQIEAESLLKKHRDYLAAHGPL